METIQLKQTKKNFNGHFTLILFPIIKLFENKTTSVGTVLGNHLVKNYYEIKSFEVIKNFLSLELSYQIFNNFLNTQLNDPYYFKYYHQKSNKKIMIEFSSPNTNKPLHLGHIRNNLIGFSIARILEKTGNNVIKAQVINDRGIHICKSMIAWMEYSNQETPKTLNLKGDHFVGKYYIIFNEIYKKEIQELIKKGKSKEEAKKQAPILLKAEKLLIKWENGDSEIHKIWNKMNKWVYDGFNTSYRRLGIKFNFTQYESNTYLLGKNFIKEGLKNRIFFKKDDGSIWCDLTNEGLGYKLLLRNNGTSVYITQDLGTVIERVQKFSIDQFIYVVGDEQNYHFEVLFSILKKFNIFENQLFKHLSYAMVDLPEGKMKSREGTVVDADNLMEEMYQYAKFITLKEGKLHNFTNEEKDKLYENIGIGALKYYLLKIDPKKKILFNPKKSIDFNGNTGPFIQYTYARIISLLNKFNFKLKISNIKQFNDLEIKIILHLDFFSEVIQIAATTLNPSLIANYTYNLAKLYNSFYQNYSILKIKDEEVKNTRLIISFLVKTTIKNALYLLGIYAPKKM